ncbi:PhzF family phenazine biosynthesis protein [Enterococcus sp. HY326]|uniref:PhzF family phenazine biosynthesis protein n=1 Tax=Enterococcus sp. HY326 TaxID=2971265 RepID=UPI00223F76E6|nr:PhzF family phenazine biosynthesis protein [Enterococcus sp. HY326]
MKQYVVDAFTDKLFSGNPAAICIMDNWLDEEMMLNITKENNLSETAFAVKTDENYQLRWFTPGGEIDLCGHATLACAYVIMNYIEVGTTSTIFQTLSGELIVEKKKDIYEMDFPAYDLRQVEVTKEIEEALGVVPKAVFLGRDLVCVLNDESVVRNIQPNFDKIQNLEGLLLHVTARGSDVDCVSRSFAPKLNVSEDPVCGSGHCHLVPYWSRILNKHDIVAFQASQRSGLLYCKANGDRVKLGGKANLFSVAELFI